MYYLVALCQIYIINYRIIILFIKLYSFKKEKRKKTLIFFKKCNTLQTIEQTHEYKTKHSKRVK